MPVSQAPGIRTAPSTPLKQSGLQWLPLSGSASQKGGTDDLRIDQSTDSNRPSITSSIYTPASSATLPRSFVKDVASNKTIESSRGDASMDVTDHGFKAHSPMFSLTQSEREKPSVYDVGPNVKSQQSVYLTGQNISSTLSQTLPRGFGSSKDAASSNQPPRTSIYAPKRFVVSSVVIPCFLEFKPP